MSKRRRRHSPEQIVKNLRDADAMLNAGQDLAAVLQALDVSEATCHRWRNQFGGLRSEEAKRLKEIVSRPVDQQGFVLLPKRWVVERTFAWLGRSRRLSKDYERTVTSSAAMIQISCIHQMLKRLEPKGTQPPFKYRLVS